jgi:hypothetical protein
MDQIPALKEELRVAIDAVIAAEVRGGAFLLLLKRCVCSRTLSAFLRKLPRARATHG